MLYVAVGSIAAALIVSLLVVRSVNRKPEKAIVASLAVQVRDGNAIYGLDSRGQLVAPAGLDSTGRNLIHAALSGAPVRVDMPDALLGKRTIVLRGAVSDQSFRVLSPVAERVLSTQPEFHWEAVKGATAYKVEIFTSDYDPAVASPKISATAWTPDKALDRGQTYSWQVTAFRANGDLTAPQPPAPEARFEVLAPSPAQKIEAARRNSNHLLAAILETEQGLREDALADIAVLEKQNSGSAVVQRLRDALRDSQPPTSR
jgi:hypothetical protein